MNLTDQLALLRLGRQHRVHPWTDQPDQSTPVPNRADRRRNRRIRGAAA
ncbi:hypothetical protein AB0J14_04520 [Micromonospora arborensis]